jgi:GTP-binding protein LepA
MNIKSIRNFCIIAHIDHGKSTLADRLLEYTGTLEQRQLKEQILDSMDLERERGITIKAHAVHMQYRAPDGQKYTLNLIDTPGHVDFSYEVSRSLAAAEGALLLIDAAQGVQAQTISTLYQAIDNDLVIIPVINKIDLPSAQIESVKHQIIELIGCDEEEIILVSAKTGQGIPEVIDAILHQIPPPEGDPEAPLQALIFDSTFDKYRGAIALIRIFNGEIEEREEIKFMASGKIFEIEELGILLLKQIRTKKLSTGEVGYLICGAKNIRDIKVGDTVTGAETPMAKPLPGYRQVKPMVFAGIYPVDSNDFEDLRSAIEKLALNDASLFYEPETSKALGFGFRCGYLGLLHMEIIQERLEREYDLNLLATSPSVEYQLVRTDGETIVIDNPADMPEPTHIDSIAEPWMHLSIFTPADYIGPIMEITTRRRGEFIKMEYLDESRVLMEYYLPLSEMIVDYYDQLKSATRGYASLDYRFEGYRAGDLVKLDVLVNGEPVDALSIIVHREQSYPRGQRLVSKLKDVIPRQQFVVPIQAAVGKKVISRANVKALRKDVLAKCYGGDITRKRKLLEKQKKGKRRMKMVGSVEIPQEAFMSVLRLGEE